CIQAREFPWTF
nr:immunoglobulin light chain junction region [Macaca mulatta]